MSSLILRPCSKVKVMGQFGKISGHSGTEFKHRVGFRTLKTNQISKMRLGASEVGLVKIPPSEINQYRSNSLVTSILITFILLLLCGVVCRVVYTAGGVLMSSIQTSDEDYCEELNNYHFERSKELHHGWFVDNPYQYCVENGNYYLQSGNVLLAQEEFQRALKVDPYGEEARLGLIKILDHYCCAKSIYCEELDEQRVFADAMGFR